MAEEFIPEPALRCPGAIELYEWVVMIFDLRNVGATYQRAMNYIFHKLIDKIVEIYIDDVVVNSMGYHEHLGLARSLGMYKKLWSQNESEQVCIRCISWTISWFYGS